jgi:hypothetical protein
MSNGDMKEVTSRLPQQSQRKYGRWREKEARKLLRTSRTFNKSYICKESNVKILRRKLFFLIEESTRTDCSI